MEPMTSYIQGKNFSALTVGILSAFALAGVGLIALISFGVGVAGGAQYFYNKNGGYIQGVSTGVSACWEEANRDMPDGKEILCGKIDKAPAGSKIISLQVGDDNLDGSIEEGEDGWDCKTMGNKICGPTP